VYNWKERNDDREKMQNRQDWKKYAHTHNVQLKRKKKSKTKPWERGKEGAKPPPP